MKSIQCGVRRTRISPLLGLTFLLTAGCAGDDNSGDNNFNTMDTANSSSSGSSSDADGNADSEVNDSDSDDSVFSPGFGSDFVARKTDWMDVDCNGLPEWEELFVTDHRPYADRHRPAQSMLSHEGFLYFADGDSLQRIELAAPGNVETLIEKFQQVDAVGLFGGTIYTAGGDVYRLTDPEGEPEFLERYGDRLLSNDSVMVVWFSTVPGTCTDERGLHERLFTFAPDGSPTEVVLDPPLCIRGVSLSDDHIYMLADVEDEVEPRAIYRLPVKGGAAEVLPLTSEEWGYAVWTEGYLVGKPGAPTTEAVGYAAPMDSEYIHFLPAAWGPIMPTQDGAALAFVGDDVLNNANPPFDDDTPCVVEIRGDGNVRELVAAPGISSGEGAYPASVAMDGDAVYMAYADQHGSYLYRAMK
jgi:hypothetical protein